MIPLTRPDGSMFLVNPDRIETVEETPDTVITLADGKKLLVREAAAQVADRFRAYQRSLRSDARFGGRRRTDPPASDDPGQYVNPYRATMRVARVDRGGMTAVAGGNGSVAGGSGAGAPGGSGAGAPGTSEAAGPGSNGASAESHAEPER